MKTKASLTSQDANLSPAAYPHTADRLTRTLILALINSGTAPESAVRMSTSLDADLRAEATQASLVKEVLR